MQSLIKNLMKASSNSSFRLATLVALLASVGCTPNRPVVPSGPENTKTGYSVTYRINGRTDMGEVEAAGEIPMEGNMTFRAAPVVKTEPEHEPEHEKDHDATAGAAEHK